MDIGRLSTQVTMQETGIAVDLAVTKIAMNSSEQNSLQMVDMIKSMELSVNPNIGANIDISL